MIKILTALIKARSALLLEVGGASTIVYGVAQYSPPSAWIVAGVAALLKSLEVDLKSGDSS